MPRSLVQSTETNLKDKKKVNRRFTEKDVWKAFKQTNEKILNIFTVREMQTKTTLKHQFSSIKITKIQKNKMVLHQGRGFDPAKPLLGNCCEVTT